MLRNDQPVSLPPVIIIDYDDVEGIDCDQSAADVARFIIPFKCEVFRAAVAVTESFAGATTTPVIDFDSRPTLGSDTGRGSADIGHIVGGTTAAGKMLYDDAGRRMILEPGEEVVVQLTTAAAGTGAAGHFIPILLVVPVPEMDANLSNLSETT